jgi:myosin heavy chain 6/7
LKNIEADYDTLQENFEEIEDGKADMQKQLSRSNAELQSWKNKYESEGIAKLEELEDSK